jgi:hypothetical protein
MPSHIVRNRSYMNCSQPARLMHLVAWLYANRERTDGKLSKADFGFVAAECQLSELEAKSAAQELVTAGLWHPGYELVDFLKWNLNRREIENRAADNLARQHTHRAKKVSPDPFQETETQNTQNTQVRNPLRNALRTTNGDVGKPTDVLVTVWCQQTGKAASSRDLAELKNWEKEFGFRVPVCDMVTTISEVWQQAVASGVTPGHPQYFRQAIRELYERTPHNRSGNGATPAEPYVERVAIGEPPPWPKS